VEWWFTTNCFVGLSRAASAAGTASGPQLPGVATPLKHLLGALKVGAEAAGGSAAGAGVPVVGVDLPQSDVPQVGGGLAGVVVHGVTVAAGLVRHDALAVGLVPAAVLGAPGGDVDLVGGRSARAGVAVVAGAVAAASSRRSGVEAISLEGASRHVDGHDGEEGDEEKVHIDQR
jgi:hypothetical protein